MSRLDDELRFAFRREEPAPDFADRVMAQIAARESKRTTVWQRLLAFFQPQPFRWIMAGATAALIVAFGMWLYAQVGKPSVDRPNEMANQEPVPDVAPAPGSEPNIAENHSNVTPEVSKPSTPRRRVSNRVHTARHEKETVEKTEGEIAKERLMLALRIASAKLNEAQRIVQNDD